MSKMSEKKISSIARDFILLPVDTPNGYVAEEYMAWTIYRMRSSEISIQPKDSSAFFLITNNYSAS